MPKTRAVSRSKKTTEGGPSRGRTAEKPTGGRGGPATSDAVAILERLTGHDPRLRRMIEEETLNAQVAMMIHQARTEAGLSQAQLAEKVGTKQPVIARLEDARYQGHSLSMLRRIADALGMRLVITFTAVDRPRGNPSP